MGEGPATQIKVISKREYDASQVVRGKPLPRGVKPSINEGVIGVIAFGPEEGMEVHDGDWIVYEYNTPSLWRQHEFASWGGYVRVDLLNVLLDIARAYRAGAIRVPIRYIKMFAKAAFLVERPHCEEHYKGEPDMETEVIDKLFLELSQVSNARTAREISLEADLVSWQRYASYCRCCALSGEHGVMEYNDFIQRVMK